MINKDELSVEELDILTGASILEDLGYKTEANGFLAILAEVQVFRKAAKSCEMLLADYEAREVFLRKKIQALRQELLQKKGGSDGKDCQ